MPNESSTAAPPVLILAADVTAAALLGALVETLGYAVRFGRPPETVEGSVRRSRPVIALLDCADPAICREDVMARAIMRGLCIVLYGTAPVLDRFRRLAERLDLATLVMPTTAQALEETLSRALERSEQRG